jgi:hypothetical protein
MIVLWVLNPSPHHCPELYTLNLACFKSVIPVSYTAQNQLLHNLDLQHETSTKLIPIYAERNLTLWPSEVLVMSRSGEETTSIRYCGEAGESTWATYPSRFPGRRPSGQPYHAKRKADDWQSSFGGKSILIKNRLWSGRTLHKPKPDNTNAIPHTQ